MDFFDQLLLFLISLCANVLSAFSGGGAGLLQLPALIFMGLPFAIALSTHKVASVALGIGATIRHVKNRGLDWKFSAFILFSGVPGVILGALVIIDVSENLARIALGCLTIFLGLYSLGRPDLGLENTRRHRTVWGYVLGGLVLFVIGLLNGSLTSGTGLFVTLWLVGWFGLDYKQAVAYTLVLVGLFWNGSGAIVLGWLTQIYWPWMPALLLGSVLGGYFGAHLAITQGSRWIKRVFEGLTLLVGVNLLWW
jgi:uncharacterized protein